ncbi:uncharacterized protein LOC132727169 [Ruditapes philippinarum]|uniref:uncharacterized protein LOC132727169 n=1 Tax=Ruditapes philippinarum TaxID=129788 RepID=UPI00295B171E|nr:uncharacterized protein LOC132727169 [Ruditapes philippinarum]
MKKKKFEGGLSVQFSRALDEIGFGENESLKRIYSMNKLSEAKNVANKQTSGKGHIEKKIVGSQSDGTGFHHFNDLDFLEINNRVYVLCKYEKHCTEFANETVIFLADGRMTPPGYVYLKPLKRKCCTNEQLHEYALVERDNETYLSSDNYLSEKEDLSQNSNRCEGQIIRQLSRAGPSIPKHIKQNPLAERILSDLNLKDTDTDIVSAFPCDAGPIMEEWSSRERKNGWPSKETISHVAKLQAHVVPVGQRGSHNEDLLWRICFTLGELHLVQNFNSIQRKIFVLMKLIAKHFLKPICNDISSYVIKNVMFWISEEILEEEFHEENFVEIVQYALKFLLKAVKTKQLQNYMIPSRNLFDGKFENNDLCIQELTDVISKYINKQETLLHDLKPIFSDLKMGHKIETIERKILDSLSTDQLVEMYMQMNSCQTPERMIHLNILYKAIPFWNTDISGEILCSEPLCKTNINNFQNHIYHNINNVLETCLNKSSSLSLNMSDVTMTHGDRNLFLFYHVFVFLPHCCM